MAVTVRKTGLGYLRTPRFRPSHPARRGRCRMGFRWGRRYTWGGRMNECPICGSVHDTEGGLVSHISKSQDDPHSDIDRGDAWVMVRGDGATAGETNNTPNTQDTPNGSSASASSSAHTSPSTDNTHGIEGGNGSSVSASNGVDDTPNTQINQSNNTPSAGDRAGASTPAGNGGDPAASEPPRDDSAQDAAEPAGETVNCPNCSAELERESVMNMIDQHGGAQCPSCDYILQRGQ